MKGKVGENIEGEVCRREKGSNRKVEEEEDQRRREKVRSIRENMDRREIMKKGGGSKEG